MRQSVPTRACRLNAQETHQRLNQASRLALLPLEVNGHRAEPQGALPRASDSMLGGLQQHMVDLHQKQPTIDKKRSGYLDLVLQSLDDEEASSPTVDHFINGVYGPASTTDAAALEEPAIPSPPARGGAARGVAAAAAAGVWHAQNYFR